MKQKKYFKKVFYTITITLSLIYIVYRAFFTLPLSLGIPTMIIAIIVLLIEIWEFIDFFTFYLNVLTVEKKSPKIKDWSGISEYPDIDVFIATLNESEAILENTISACKNMNYPDKSKIHIYLCDDGNRNSVKSLAKKLEINYITRLTNKNAKAGNYNHALSVTNSPYVATFDADMCPTEDFLLKTVPYFFDGHKENKKIGFVQLPQSFVNPDIFQYRFGLENKIPFEQDYFYHSIQLANNVTNSTICCGTNVVFSREALIKSEGFATKSISEDIATGMLIESNGYKCIASDSVEAYGLSVTDLSGFLKQRSRWARGCIQILKNYKIIGNKGLTFRQKLEYLSCISYWFFGIKRMIYLITPLLFSIFGMIIIDCDLKVFLSLWLPSYVLKRFAIDLVENNKRSSTWNKIYEIILTPVLFKEALKELFGFGNTKFDVSPKNEPSKKMSKANINLLFSHFTFFILNLIGLVMCIYKITQSSILLYVLSLIWIISNIYYLLIAIVFDVRYKPSSIKGFIPNKIKVFNKLSSLLVFFNKSKKIAND